MAINKVVNGSKSSHRALSNVVNYVLRNDDLQDYIMITGPYFADTINSKDVYKAFLDEKRLWDKDSGRMYAHNIISFHKDENITAFDCLDIGIDFSQEFFSGYQNLIAVHQDKEHLHVHIITNSVSFLDGIKLHQSRNDLQKQKDYTNQLCRERGFSVAKKGKYFDGSTAEEGTITAWDKDKYNFFLNDSKKSYVAECAKAVMTAKEKCPSKAEFIERMEQGGWAVTWTDSRKYITFTNQEGQKVRCSNLSKTFNLDISKEALEREFKRFADNQREQDEIGIAARGITIEEYIRENQADQTSRGTKSRESNADRAARDQERERYIARKREEEKQRIADKIKQQREAEAAREREQRERNQQAQRIARQRNAGKDYSGR